MTTALLLVPWVALHAATLSPPVVPARGKAEVNVTLDAAGYYRLRADTPAGTACELADPLRGPFAYAGVRGGKSCQTDLLLDSGAYRLRLSSPTKAKGQLTPTLTPFRELQPEPLQLRPGTSLQTRLGEQQQSSYTLRVEKTGPLLIRIAGRTVGDVRLWRGGEFIEALSPAHSEITPQGGQPQHEWWLSTDLEAGDYRLVAYGTSALPWTQGKPEDLLSVDMAFPQADALQGGETGTLPSSGFWALRLPSGAIATVLSAPAGNEGRLELGTFSADSSGLFDVSRAASHCDVPRKALWRQCGALEDASVEHLLWVRGPPGTSFSVQWAPAAVSSNFVDGAYGSPGADLDFEGPDDGTFLIATNDVPGDTDAAPLSCTLLENQDESQQLVARDALPLPSDAPFEQTFNYDGNREVLEFQVVKAGRYRVATTGQRKSQCELYALNGLEGNKLSESNPKGGKCELTLALGAGFHQLTLNNGTAGIETVRISPAGTVGKGQGVTRTACLFPHVNLKRGLKYRLQLSRVGFGVRGLFVRPLPLRLDAPLPLSLAPHRTLQLPVAANQAFIVKTVAEAPVRCGWKDGGLLDAHGGACAVPFHPGPGTLSLEAKGEGSTPVLLVRPQPERKQPPAQRLVPRPMALPTLELESPVYFTLDRHGSHSRLVTVKEAGLYDVSTEGLLATRCELRTPVIPALGQDTSSGRGRNCLLQSYLRPGRYLVTVHAEGQSKGRASLRFARRPQTNVAAVTGNSEAYFRSNTDELIQQALTIKAGGTYRIATESTAGAPLSCRLEDAAGWPLVPVPTPCQLEKWLKPGSYRWTQLPVTVETQRRTTLERVVRSKLLRGNRPHAVSLNTDYQALLGKDGHDEFLFELSADAPVRILLTNGMQGRLYARADEKRAHVLEVIPSTEAPASAPAPAAVAPESDEAGEPAPEEPVAEDEGEAEEEVQGQRNEQSPPPVSTQLPEPIEAPEPPGHPLELKAGAYRLVTEHSRGDVAIRYTVAVGSQLLFPGSGRELPIPGHVKVRVPQSGVLRLVTRGSADVRCRLFGPNGTLIAESSDRGLDWNCALAEPVAAGDHELVLESENALAGKTRVELEAPTVQELATLPDKGEWSVKDQVLRVALPVVPEGTVEDVELSSSTPFSCALEEATGKVVSRVLSAPRCDVHLSPRGQAYRLRVWTLGEAATVQVRSGQRSIQNGKPGRLAPDALVRLSVPRPGRYRTSEDILCARDNGPALLRPCGPEVSLETGPLLFASSQRGKAAQLPLEEQILRVEQPVSARRRLGETAFIQNQSSGTPAVHLLTAQVAVGAHTSPACAFSGGVRARTPLSCFAASGLTKEAQAWAWLPSGADDVELTQRSIVAPSQAVALSPGAQTLRWKGHGLRVKLPSTPFHVAWTLPPDSWAVQLDGSGKAVDLCAPQPALARCGFVGQGGEVFLTSLHDTRLEAEVALLETLPPPLELSGLYEDVLPGSGALVFRVGHTTGERHLEVQGAVACALDREDGLREGRCEAVVPGGMGARLWVRHGAGPLRVLLARPEDRAAALVGESSASQGEPAQWQPGQRVSVAAQPLERLVILPKEAAFRLESATGVCALYGRDGLLAVDGEGVGCDLQRVLTPGRYRVVIRPFGGESPRGGAQWSSRPIEVLREGAGPEAWASPGEIRYFRFSTASPGRVGLGLRAPSDLLDCAVLDEQQRPLGAGCQQLLALPQGSFLLTVRAPPNEGPQRFNPVLVGLAGAKTQVHQDYLESFFQRIGDTQ
jgi:hypothetical protein